MSIVNDKLFEDKISELKRIEDELQAEKNSVLIVLGEWLANALDDKENVELRKLFISKHDDKKYLSLKRQRSVTEKIAENVKALDKTKDSNHAENIASADSKSEKISTDNSENTNAHFNPNK